MRENALISIITPLYNSEKYLSNTISSVLHQSYCEWEWIIVNDCSTDDSLNMALSVDDPRIHIISLDINSGTSKSRNVGLDNAKGRYIVFLDADDELDKSFLEDQLRFIKEKGPIVTAGYRRKTLNSITEFLPPSKISYKKLLKGNPISCLTTMYDFAIFPHNRFDESIHINEDYLFWLSLLSGGYSVYCNTKVLATYNLHKGSKNIKKIRLLLPTYNIYRFKLGLNIIKSLYYLTCISLYSIRKYKNVK